MSALCGYLPRIAAGIGLLVTTVALTPVGAAVAHEASDFRWTRTVRLPDGEPRNLTAISLDSTIFAATRDDLADIRLRDGRGKAVAFVIRGDRRQDQANRGGGQASENLQSYPLADFASRENAEHGQTVLEFSGQRQPLTLVRLETEGTNFRRQATLDVATEVRGQQKWRTLASATLSRLSLDGLNKNELAIAFPQQRGERYRVVIENHDSPAVVFRGVDAFGPEYKIVFLATPGQSLTLEYGWPRAKTPSYDVAAIDAALAAGKLPAMAELDPPVQNQPLANAGRWSELVADTPLLVGVIAVLSVLLGWGIFRAAARIDASPPA